MSYVEQLENAGYRRQRTRVALSDATYLPTIIIEMWLNDMRDMRIACYSSSGSTTWRLFRGRVALAEDSDLGEILKLQDANHE